MYGEPDPIENGVQQVYNDIRESIDLLLHAEVDAGNGPLLLPESAIRSLLVSLDDAISNNWDELMLAFWRGVREDIDVLTAMDGDT